MVFETVQLCIILVVLITQIKNVYISSSLENCLLKVKGLPWGLAGLGPGVDSQLSLLQTLVKFTVMYYNDLSCPFYGLIYFS